MQIAFHSYLLLRKLRLELLKNDITLGHFSSLSSLLVKFQKTKLGFANETW